MIYRLLTCNWCGTSIPTSALDRESAQWMLLRSIRAPFERKIDYHLCPVCQKKFDALCIAGVPKLVEEPGEQ